MDVAGIECARTASGSSDIGSLFCLIPFGSDPYKNALEALHRNAALKRNEVLVNFRDDSGRTRIAYLWCNDRLTVSADVVALTPATTNDTSHDVVVPTSPPPAPLPSARPTPSPPAASTP